MIFLAKEVNEHKTFFTLFNTKLISISVVTFQSYFIKKNSKR